jgi:hypothetical protein
MSEQVKNLFNGANKVTPAIWSGVSPDMAKTMYGVADVELFKKAEVLVGRRICIIGHKEQQNEKGVYRTFLFVPDQETVALGMFSLSSKPFIDMICRSKLPVAGTLEKCPCKKGSYWNLKS